MELAAGHAWGHVAAQATSEAQSSLHGHVEDENGLPVAAVEVVVLSSDGNLYRLQRCGEKLRSREFEPRPVPRRRHQAGLFSSERCGGRTEARVERGFLDLKPRIRSS